MSRLGKRLHRLEELFAATGNEVDGSKAALWERLNQIGGRQGEHQVAQLPQRADQHAERQQHVGAVDGRAGEEEVAHRRDQHCRQPQRPQRAGEEPAAEAQGAGRAVVRHRSPLREPLNDSPDPMGKPTDPARLGPVSSLTLAHPIIRLRPPRGRIRGVAQVRARR